MTVRNNRYPGDAWLERYRERVSADQEMFVIGDWFTTTLALTFEDDRSALRIDAHSGDENE